LTGRRSQRLRLVDIALQISAIQYATVTIGREEFEGDWLRRSAVERGLEVISEATRHLDESWKLSEPEIPWRRIADIGNWLRHAYDRVDPELIWLVTTDELPKLSAAVTRLLDQVSED